MSSTLALRLAGPLQSWSASNRLMVRGTESFPTRSGVIGMLAAALGWRRDHDLGQLQGLRLGVRLDQQGVLLRDYHTVSGASWPTNRLPTADGKRRETGQSQVTQRWYLMNAAFLAVLEGEGSVLEMCDRALRTPVFPLFLGRKSCVPTVPITLGVSDASLMERLTGEPLLVAHHEVRGGQVAVVVDDPDGVETLQDDPITFDQRAVVRHRGRRVRRIMLSLPEVVEDDRRVHDPLTLLEED